MSLERPKPKVGVYICHCGKNIADVIDMDEITEYSKHIPNVVLSKNFKFMCSNAGQDLIAQDLKSGKVDRVVVAACSPLMHEATYRRVMNDNDVNEFFF